MKFQRSLLAAGVLAAALAVPGVAAEANSPKPIGDNCTALSKLEKTHGRFHPLRFRKALEDGFSGFGVAVSSIGMKQPACSVTTPSELGARVAAAQPLYERVGDGHGGQAALANQREVVELAARLNFR